MYSSWSSLWIIFVCVLSLVLVATGCGGGAAILTADPTGAPLFEQGQDALVEEDWKKVVAAFDTLCATTRPVRTWPKRDLGSAVLTMSRVGSRV